jgi:GT2 family glycosyltransferase
MKEIDVSIILVNYNTKQLTIDCLNSIFDHAGNQSFEVIVVDNASTDGSEEILSNDSRITYIRNVSNLGFGKANNVGVERAKGEYLFFLNTDTLIVDDAIHGMWQYMKSNVDVGVCGVNLVDGEMNPTMSFERLFPSCRYMLNEMMARIPGRIVYGRNSYYNFKKHPIKVAYVSGADLMIKKTVFEKIGGFDKGFFMYLEETDLCYQVKKLGLSVVTLSNYHIIHFGGKSFANTSSPLPSYEKLKIQFNSANNYKKKNFNKFNTLIYDFLYSIVIYLRCTMYLITCKKDKLAMWKNVKKLNKEIK